MILKYIQFLVFQSLLVLVFSFVDEQCPKDVQIFTKSKKKIIIKRLHGSGWNETVRSDNQYDCQCQCQLKSKCKSIQFSEGNGNCVLQDLTRMSVNIKMKKANQNTTFYDLSKCPIKDNDGMIGVIEDAVDCKDIYEQGFWLTGVYAVLGEEDNYQTMRCEMDLLGGGWTVIQKRFDGSISFDRDWEEYKYGFGDLDGEFWYGNDRIHYLTNSTDNEVLMELHSIQGKVYFPAYDQFRVDSEENMYKLTVGEFIRTGKGAYVNPIGGFDDHDGYLFSTRDRDNDFDLFSCSERNSNAGWWFGSCMTVYLNGKYDDPTTDKGIEWDTLTHDNGVGESDRLNFTKIMVRKKSSNVLQDNINN